MSSDRVRLEVAILAADEAPLENVPPPHDAETVMILAIAADAAVRRYVEECLRSRTNIRVLAAATVSDGLTIAARHTPRVLVVDAAQSEILMALVHVRAVILVDETPCGTRSAGSGVRFLARPFTSRDLMAAVDQLLAVSA
jgi:CheY-like chemotaxis protein